MNPNHETPTKVDPPSDDREDRLLRAVEEFQAEVDQGRTPERQRFLQRYPDLAEELGRCLDGLRFVQTAKPRLGSAISDVGSLATGQLADAVRPATPLGDFQIVRELGRGGMGVVYEAIQLSLGRPVALKVLPFAATHDARRLQRFRTEAQAAAQLHHTNIVPVFAVGQDRGVHFYAMQLIDGQSLAVVLERLRAERTGRPGEPEAQADGSTGALAISTQRSTRPGDYHRTIARWMQQAALALEHAHQFGIVHRDVKPANLLIQNAPTGADPAKMRLWITDFGLAQVQSEAELTQTGDILGTLRYMSPEQAGGQRQLIDQRTDVYSLGATLYELATLEPIFPGRDRQRLLQQILLEDPRPPRRVDPAIPVELETIILKATQKNPQDRYGTAQSLADDLQRFLEHKPILARRPTVVDRVRKWSRRHPSAVGGLVVLLLLCIGGLLINNRMIANEEAKTAQRAREAEEQFRLARRAADEMIEIAEQELAEDPVQENLRRRLLETALEYYQDFSRRHSGDSDAPGLEATRDRVKKILDDLSVMQGDRRNHLLREPSVLDDLGLTDDKRARIADLTKQLDQQRQAIFRETSSLTPEALRQRLLEHARASESAIAANLNQQELSRLRQIALQCQGTRGLRDPSVAATLKLTAEQKDRIRDIEMEAFFGRGDLPPNGLAFRGSPDERLKRAMARIVEEVLTPEQAEHWQALVGNPYKGPMPFLFPAPGPGGPKGPPRLPGPQPMR